MIAYPWEAFRSNVVVVKQANPLGKLRTVCMHISEPRTSYNDWLLQFPVLFSKAFDGCNMYTRYFWRWGICQQSLALCLTRPYPPRDEAWVCNVCNQSQVCTSLCTPIRYTHKPTAKHSGLVPFWLGCPSFLKNDMMGSTRLYGQPEIKARSTWRHASRR